MNQSGIISINFSCNAHVRIIIYQEFIIAKCIIVNKGRYIRILYNNNNFKYNIFIIIMVFDVRHKLTN